MSKLCTRRQIATLGQGETLSALRGMPLPPLPLRKGRLLPFFPLPIAVYS
jgi:hypothetical protein